MQPVQAWPPGSPGRWGSPFSVPWMVDLRRHPQGMTIPKGVWMVTCASNAGVVMRVNLSLAVQLDAQPDLLTSIPPVVPLPLLPAPPTPPAWRTRRAPPPQIDYYEDGGTSDWIVDQTVVAPCHTGTVWSDGWNLRLCGCGGAMLIKVSS